jgi:hypothetical protein
MCVALYEFLRILCKRAIALLLWHLSMGVGEVRCFYDKRKGSTVLLLNTTVVIKLCSEDKFLKNIDFQNFKGGEVMEPENRIKLLEHPCPYL